MVVFAILLILAGLFFAGAGGYLIYRKNRLAKGGQRVTGTVVGAREHDVRTRTGVIRNVYPVVAFQTLHGQEIRAVAIHQRSGGDGVGAQVPVLYNPQNPVEFEIDTPGGQSSATAYAGVAVGLVTLIVAVVLLRIA